VLLAELDDVLAEIGLDRLDPVRFQMVVHPDFLGDHRLALGDGLRTGLAANLEHRGAGIGEGRKSVAIEVTLQPRGSAMKDEEIEAISQSIVKAVTKATGASLRG
jgi:phenylalanyl-tRNA synthetase beta chain